MKIFVLLVFIVGICQGLVTPQRAAPFLPRENSKQCEGPDGTGLDATLTELVKFIPLEKVLGVVLTAMTSDKEVQDVMSYLTSDETLTRIQRIFKTDEIRQAIQLACQDLHFDVIYYINRIALLFGLPPLEHNSMRMPRDVTNLSPGGIRGLVLNMLDIIDVENMKVFMQDKLKSDKYVQMAYKAFYSAEGREAIEKAMNNSDIQKLVEDLLKLIANFSAVIEDIRNVFGWWQVYEEVRN